MHLAIISLLLATTGSESHRAEIESLSARDKSAMLNVTWHPGCPVPLEELRSVHVPYKSSHNQTQNGILIVHKDVAQEVSEIFHALYQIGFVIEEISPALTKHGQDEALMRSNITSAFNCRPITGGRGFSRHSFGKAIDINPLWNPYIKGKRVLPKQAPTFARPPRDIQRPGLIYRGSPIVKLFRTRGWQWGGNWKRVKDFQHFEKKSR